MFSFLLKPISFLFIILFTWFLKRLGLFHKSLALVVLAILMNITLPATVITVFGNYGFDKTMLWLTFVGVAASMTPYFLTYFFSRRLPREKRIFYMISMSGFNIGCYGLPILQALFGPLGAMSCIMFDMGNTVMMSSGNYAFTSLLLPTEGEEKVTVGKMIRRFFSSVPLLCYIVLIILSLCGIRFTGTLVDFVTPMANANAFLAMFMLGLLFSPPAKRSDWKDTVLVLVFRYAFLSAVAFLCWKYLPVPQNIRDLLVVILFCPIGSFAPAFIEKCHGDGELASFANSVSTILSLVIMTALSYRLIGG